MKSIQNPFSILILFSCFFVTCIPADEFAVPESYFREIELSGTAITMRALKSTLDQEIEINGNELLHIDTDNYLHGFVISTDQFGNFFEELIIQNRASEADRGLKLLLDQNPLFQYFEPGRKVYVQLKGLHAGYHSGQLAVLLRRAKDESISQHSN